MIRRNKPASGTASPSSLKRRTPASYMASKSAISTPARPLVSRFQCRFRPFMWDGTP